jgi:hypothetical protein
VHPAYFFLISSVEVGQDCFVPSATIWRWNPAFLSPGSSTKSVKDGASHVFSAFLIEPQIVPRD